jgi:hypothetical protein
MRQAEEEKREQLTTAGADTGKTLPLTSSLRCTCMNHQHEIRAQRQAERKKRKWDVTQWRNEATQRRGKQARASRYADEVMVLHTQKRKRRRRAQLTFRSDESSSLPSESSSSLHFRPLRPCI